MSIPKQGPGQRQLQEKRDIIAQFIGRTLDVTYVPAVRDRGIAVESVQRMLDQALRSIEDSEDYIDALKVIEDLQRPVLEQVGGALAKTLSQFIPDVRNVSLALDSDGRYRALRQQLRVVVDDGNPTDLGAKGDGVQSLAAVAITRHFAEVAGRAREYVLAIEEPESHLHPDAIHQLHGTLVEMSTRQQVVISTHNPIFVNRSSVSDNIVVQGNRARPAKSVDEIRVALGIRVSDNLRSATHVIVVEGESDRRILGALVKARSNALSARMVDGALVFQSLGGGSRLSYSLGRLRADVCHPFAIVDGDQSGLAALDNAVANGVIDRRHTYAISVPGQGRRDSEIEDLIDPIVYSSKLQSEHGIILPRDFVSRRGKWSDEVACAAEDSGKLWSERVERNVKTLVADCVEDSVDAAVHDRAERLVANLITQLESWAVV